MLWDPGSCLNPIENVNIFVLAMNVSGCLGCKLQLTFCSLWFQCQFSLQRLCCTILFCPTYAPHSGQSGTCIFICLLVQFSKCFLYWCVLDPCMYTWGWAQKFINNFMGLLSQAPRLHDLLGTLWFPRAPFSILLPESGVYLSWSDARPSPGTSSLKTRKKN